MEDAQVSFTVRGFKDLGDARPTCIFAANDPTLVLAAGECMIGWGLQTEVCWTSFVGVPESGIMQWDEFKATYGNQTKTEG